MTAKEQELLHHNASILADRCGHAIASGNEAAAAKLARCAAAHLDDHALVFADLHYLMALAADDAGVVQGFLESCERFAQTGRGTEAEVMAEVGLPLARAGVAHRRGGYGEVVEQAIGPALSSVTAMPVSGTSPVFLTSYVHVT